MADAEARERALLEALRENGIEPEVLCECAHIHIAGDEGEDAGCRVCECAAWKPHPVLSARPTEGARSDLLRRAAREPLHIDISDFSDEFCAGFLAGQVNALEELERGVLSARPTEETAG